MRLAGGLMGRVGDDTAAVFEVRGEHAVVSGEMGAGAWHEGGEAGDVAAKAFARVPLMGLAARADPRLHHSGGLWRENPES